MSLNRRAAKRDCNEQPIIRTFEALGAAVQQLSARGVPDLLVSYLGDLHLVEVKWESAGLTEDQLAWHDLWVQRGAKRPQIVRTEAHARKCIRMWTMEFARREQLKPDVVEDLAQLGNGAERKAS